jgi:hypothetical protein
MRDNMKVYSKNFDNACTDLKLRQERKRKLNAAHGANKPIP